MKTKTTRLLIASSFALVLLSTAGCPPPWPKCEKDSHCEKNDNGEVMNYVCVNGQCRECATDANCQEGFICRENACVPKPECTSDAECTGGLVCRNEKCVPECTTNSDCSTGMMCKDQRCVPAVECTSNADCEEGKECSPEGKCVQAAPKCTVDTVYFDFNSFSLTSEARTTLEADAQCLEQRQGPVTLEGFADERGTEEYNLALGEKRANSVKKYLTTLGVDSSRLKTVSYGEERPVCTTPDEDCWAQNRRVEFELAEPGL